MAGDRWVKPDRRYRAGYRGPRYSTGAFFKWAFLLFAWVIVTTLLVVFHAGILTVVTTGLLAWYALRRIRAYYRRPQFAPSAAAQIVPDQHLRFNPPPGWPAFPPGWVPEPGWRPDPSWPPLPIGWQLWVPDEEAPRGV
jgi:hypothetical protein